jgi:hypothetical protein
MHACLPIGERTWRHDSLEMDGDESFLASDPLFTATGAAPHQLKGRKWPAERKLIGNVCGAAYMYKDILPPFRFSCR